MEKTIEYYLSLDYSVEIRKITEDLGGGYMACIPCLGSQAFVGDGETPQEAYENLQAAKAEIFADYLAEGLPIPEPPSTTEHEDFSGKLMVRMPRELHARVAWAAKANDVSLNQYIVYALSNFESKWQTVAQMRSILEEQHTPSVHQEAQKDEYKMSATPDKPLFTISEYQPAA